MDQTVELPGSMPAAAAAATAAATAAAGALGSTRPGELLTMQSCPAIHTDMQPRTLLSIHGACLPQFHGFGAGASGRQPCPRFRRPDRAGLALRPCTLLRSSCWLAWSWSRCLRPSFGRPPT